MSRRKPATVQSNRTVQSNAPGDNQCEAPAGMGTPFAIARGSIDQNIPALFASIFTSSKVDPLIKYRRTFEGASPADVATIGQGKAFQTILVQEIAARNIIAPAPMLIAQEEGGMKASYIAVEEMLLDGFPDHQPCHLHLLFARGEELAEEDRGSTSGLSHTDRNTMIEVADAIRFWFTGQQQNVLNDIAR